MSALKIAVASFLLLSSQLTQAIEPSTVEVSLYAQEQEFQSSGPVIGLNPTPLESDETGLILCNPGIDCDRLAIHLELPAETSQFFPFAQLRLSLTWSSATALPIDDFDMYLYDEDGNLLGRADRTTLTDGIGEELVFALSQIPNTLVLEIYYFLSVAASYSGEVVLDLGPSAEGVDAETFWANNPPPSSRMQSPTERGSSAGSAGFLVLALLAAGLARRIPNQARGRQLLGRR